VTRRSPLDPEEFDARQAGFAEQQLKARGLDLSIVGIHAVSTHWPPSTQNWVTALLFVVNPRFFRKKLYLQ